MPNSVTAIQHGQKGMFSSGSMSDTQPSAKTTKHQIMNEFMGAYNLEHMNQKASPAVCLIT